MGATPQARRILVVAFVLVLHGGIWIAFVEATRAERASSTRGQLVSTLVLLGQWDTYRPGSSASRGAERPAGLAPLRSLPELEGAAPGLAFPGSEQRPPVDWTQAARAAASALLTEQHKGLGASGTPPPGAAPGSMFGAPGRRLGTETRAPAGSPDVWLSDQCYATERMPTPNVPEHMMNSIIQCLPKPRAPIPRDLTDIRRALDARVNSSLP